jgi:UDP-N-acetylmuramoylalanine--D-glutamate ligase
MLYPSNFPALGRAYASDIPFHSLTELYFGLSPAPITAVTGSVGKSTTSRLVETMLRSSGVAVHFAGNERRSNQVLARLSGIGPDARLVLEVSNRQLVDLAPQPDVAIVTTIVPNHLEEHGRSFDEYREVKTNLVRNQTPGQRVVLNQDDEGSRPLLEDVPGERWTFSLSGPVPRGTWLEAGRVKLNTGDGAVLDLGPASAKGLLGEHNAANVLAAAAGAFLSGATPEGIAAGVQAFVPPRHRLQLVWRADGTEFYDDVNATSPHATVAAFRALDRPIVWIAGGQDKGLPLDDLVAEARARVRALVLLPGAGSDRLAAIIHGLPHVRVNDLRAAVGLAVEMAGPGDAVLLSPSFPGFFSRNFAEDGGYRALLRELAVEKTRESEERVQ